MSAPKARASAAGMPAPAVLRPTDHRIGILGGTFDPIHFGHLVIADEVREALALDRVIFIPAAQPPHKIGLAITSAEERAEMVELAIHDNPAFAMSRIELARSGPSYTVDTLEILTEESRRLQSQCEFFFILSAEAVSALPTWRAPARILGLARLAVVARPGYPLGDVGLLTEKIGLAADSERILNVDTVPIAHSASAIRRRVAAGKSIRYLVPPEVEAYVASHGLYRSAKPAEEPAK